MRALMPSKEDKYRMKLEDKHRDKLMKWVENEEYLPFQQMQFKLVVQMLEKSEREAWEEVERLKFEKNMLFNICNERHARARILTEENERLKKEKEKLQMEIDWLTFGEKIAYELCDEQEEQIRMLTEEKERLKSQLDDALKTYEITKVCAEMALDETDPHAIMAGLTEVVIHARRAIQRIKGEQEHEQK